MILRQINMWLEVDIPKFEICSCVSLQQRSVRYSCYMDQTSIGGRHRGIVRAVDSCGSLVRISGCFTAVHKILRLYDFERHVV
jgi:hypothetical protein